MRIAISSQSAAVARTLDAAIRAAGHSPTADAAQADLLICDLLHPAPLPATPCPQLQLVASLTTREDALTCPIRPLALIQRLQARAQLPTIPLGHGWLLDPTSRTLTHPTAEALSLTEKESRLLHALAHADATPLRREALLADIWGVGSDIDTHTLETHIYRLRSKLEAATPPIGDITTEDGAYHWVIKN